MPTANIFKPFSQDIEVDVIYRLHKFAHFLFQFWVKRKKNKFREKRERDTHTHTNTRQQLNRVKQCVWVMSVRRRKSISTKCDSCFMILGCVFAFFSPGSGLCSVLDSVYMIVVDESSRQHRLHTRNTISTRTRRKYLTPICLPVHVFCCIFMKCVCLGPETRKTNHIIQNGMMLIQQQQNAQEAVFLGRSPLLYRISLEISLWVHDVTCGYWIHTQYNI